ncbi:MAG: hypothetical protein R3C56_31730 [Pirellulaceae bacterium]
MGVLPYDVEVLYVFDDTVSASPLAQQVWLAQVKADLERTFQAAWNVRFSPLSGDLAPVLLRHFDDFTFAELQAQVAMSKTTETNGSTEANHPSQSNELPKPDAKRVQSAKVDSLWRERDKLFYLLVRRQGDETIVQVRELDGPLRFLGPAMSDSTSDWSYAARLASSEIVRAFAPVARVEDAESRAADLTLRAGGLIVQPDNPANVIVGDVMQPIVRRDDRNGVPTLLQPLPWTFAAVTDSDGVKLKANVYTYSGGPGLQGRKNRRTQRMLLKVRPQFEQSELELVVAGGAKPQAGCFIYSRDFLTDQFSRLGRTDWRGRLTIAIPAQQTEIIPEAVRAQRAAAKREAARRAATSSAAEAASEAASEATAASAAIAPEEALAENQSATPTPAEETPADETSVQTETPAIPLQTPLVLLYVKQGDRVLAKLPMVPGLAQVATAELPDDRRRLLAEAFVHGFQGEILNVVGMRNLLAARVKRLVAKDQPDAAKATVEELRRLSNYTDMADQLEAIQRRMLDETNGPIPLAAKSRIDVLFQTTRNMLQKYLQDSLLTDSERAIANP